MWLHVRVRLAAVGVYQIDLGVAAPNRIAPRDAPRRFAVVAVLVVVAALAFSVFVHPFDSSATRCAPRCSGSSTVTRSSGTSSTCIQDPGCGGAAVTTSRAPASPAIVVQPATPAKAAAVGYRGHETIAPVADRLTTSGLFRPPR
jgi:hypothetical protein